MWGHIQKYHEGVRGPSDGAADFKMEVVALDKDPMRRIIREALRIKDADRGVSEVDVEVEQSVDGGATIKKVVEKVKVSLMNDKKELFLPRIIAVQQL